MKKASNHCFKQTAHFFASLILLLFVNILPCYATLDVTITFDNNCEATIKTTISDLAPGESSSLFYRLEHDGGSYSWREGAINSTPPGGISQGAVVKMTYIQGLPYGNYTIVCYETRKNKPIRVKGNSGNNNNTCSGNKLPMIKDVTGSTSLLQVIPSWNIFTGIIHASIAESQYTINSTLTNTDPWLFVTLSTFLGSFTTPITVEFNSNALVYEGAIINNVQALNSSALWKWVSNISDNGNGTLTITQAGNRPDNLQDNIHLIFKQKSGGDLGRLPTLDFKASGQHFHNGLIQTLISPGVYGAPHDPNALQVDQLSMCFCQQERSLTYKVEFQNIGSAPVANINIELLNINGLKIPTLEMLNANSITPKSGTTGRLGKPVVFTDGTKVFAITGINLPGLAQFSYASKEHETRDYIEFKVRTNACLKDGTSIRPVARVTFVGVQGYLDTNIGETQVKSQISINGFDEPCPTPNSSICPDCDKKPCWLISWLCQKKKR